MLSPGEALRRYPDSGMENEDGSETIVYTNVSETDFNIFNVYLKAQGAELISYRTEGSRLIAEIGAKGRSFSMDYDTRSGEMSLTYPAGTRAEGVAEAFVPGISILPAVGGSMPSMGEVLKRYPDSETENGDGSVTEIFTQITDEEFNAFVADLEEQGARTADLRTDGRKAAVKVPAKNDMIAVSYDSGSGEAKVTYPAGTYDERMREPRRLTLKRLRSFWQRRRFAKALAEILKIPQYRKYAPAEELLAGDEGLAGAAADREARLEPYRTIGKLVALGAYQQDMMEGDEPIGWIVLDYDEEENKALLFSRYGLDARRYNDEDTDITWENCLLRKWLNTVFLRNAFSKEEQSAILTTTVDNSKAQGAGIWNTYGGKDTEDKVFLLSYAEAHQYLELTDADKTGVKPRVAPTLYAFAERGARAKGSPDVLTEDGLAAALWCLRSPGWRQANAALVDMDGRLQHESVYADYPMVCPAVRVNLDDPVLPEDVDCTGVPIA